MLRRLARDPALAAAVVGWCAVMLPGGYPPGVSVYDVEGDHTVECANCEARVDLDDAVGWSGGDEMFCDVRCLVEWAADNLERVVEWIKV